MRKRKKLKSWHITIGLFFIILTLPFAIWILKPSKSLDVVIINKTVPDRSYREHKGFVWILNNLKITNGNLKTPFKVDEDYYGFFPLPNEEYKTKQLPQNLGTPNLIYLTDTYGVYKEDFYKNNKEGNRSEIIYGGTTIEEVNSIKNSLNDNFIIGEFNTLASPTEDKAKEELENIFGLRWSGWIGRYFEDLSKDNIEIPDWMKDNFVAQQGERWNFKGAGMVLVNADDKIIVLRKDIELGTDLNKINFTEKAEKEFRVKNNVNYYYWFEIAKADKGTEILAQYKIDVTKEGQKILDEYDLPIEFPAIVRKAGEYTSYYFAGDFADSNATPSIYNVAGIDFLNKITTLDEDSNQNYFYWNVYYPLIKNIVKNIK